MIKDPTKISPWELMTMNAKERDMFLTKQEKSDYNDWLMKKMKANTLQLQKKGGKGKKGGGKVGMRKGGLARRKRK